MPDIDGSQASSADIVLLGKMVKSPAKLLLIAAAARSQRSRVVVLGADRDPQPLADSLRAGAD